MYPREMAKRRSQTVSKIYNSRSQEIEKRCTWQKVNECSKGDKEQEVRDKRGHDQGSLSHPAHQIPILPSDFLFQRQVECL